MYLHNTSQNVMRCFSVFKKYFSEEIKVKHYFVSHLLKFTILEKTTTLKCYNIYIYIFILRLSYSTINLQVILVLHKYCILLFLFL